jgi:hypothetical protein
MRNNGCCTVAIDVTTLLGWRTVARKNDPLWTESHRPAEDSERPLLLPTTPKPPLRVRPEPDAGPIDPTIRYGSKAAAFAAAFAKDTIPSVTALKPR